MPRKSVRTVLLPDYAKQLRAIRQDPSIRSIAIDDEIRAAGIVGHGPLALQKLMQSATRRRLKQLKAVAKHLRIDADGKNGWFKAFEALVQATLHAGCYTIQERSTRETARTWRPEQDRLLLEEFFVLRRSMTDGEAIAAISEQPWIPYRPQQPTRRAKGRPSQLAKQQAIRRHLARLRGRSTASLVDLIGSPPKPGDLERLEADLIRMLFIAKLRKNFGQS